VQASRDDLSLYSPFPSKTSSPPLPSAAVEVVFPGTAYSFSLFPVSVASLLHPRACTRWKLREGTARDTSESQSEIKHRPDMVQLFDSPVATSSPRLRLIPPPRDTAPRRLESIPISAPIAASILS